jgi:hypothetical protein
MIRGDGCFTSGTFLLPHMMQWSIRLIVADATWHHIIYFGALWPLQ